MARTAPHSRAIRVPWAPAAQGERGGGQSRAQRMGKLRGVTLAAPPCTKVARGAATLRLLQRNMEFGDRIFLKGDARAATNFIIESRLAGRTGPHPKSAPAQPGPSVD